MTYPSSNKLTQPTRECQGSYNKCDNHWEDEYATQDSTKGNSIITCKNSNTFQIK